MKTIHRHIVSAVLLTNDDKILMAFKNSDRKRAYADCWHIPGGGVEAGETDDEALIREVQEEVGLDIRAFSKEPVRLEYIGRTQKETPQGELVEVEMTFAPYIVHLPMDSHDVAIVLNEEFSKFIWVDKSQLHTVQLTPPSTELFKAVQWLYL